MHVYTKDDIQAYNKKLFNLENDNLKSLEEAVKKENLVVFWGAGVSSIGGCETWSGLTNKLIEQLTKADIFNFAEQQGMKNISLKSLRTAITICRTRVKQKTGSLKLFYDAILSGVEPASDRIEKFKKIHNSILALKARFYITTNIDLGAQQKLEENDFLKREFINLTNVSALEARQKKNKFLTKSNLIFDLTKNGNVFYLHGTKDIIESSIFSDENYNEFYSNDYINEFFDEIFSGKYTFLFLGYSLSDHEIMSNIYTGLKKEYKGEIRHYSLIPAFASDLNNLSLEKEYLNIYSIQPLYYLIDYDYYDTLFDVLEYLKEYIYLVKPVQDLIPSLGEMESI